MIYEYKCLSCKHVTDLSRSMDHRDAPAHCGECGGETKRIISGGQGFRTVLGGADMPGYMCPVTDTWVDSKRKRDRIMKEHDLVEMGDTKGVHR